MNPSFIKMLRFEWKANFAIWIFNLIIALSVLFMFFYALSESTNTSGLRDVYFILFILLTWLFTLYSYQESTNSQSMQMYHLIGVSRNVKFLSKQFITFLVFPMLMIVVTALSVTIINYFNLGKEQLEILPRTGKIILVFVLWILGHSTSTLLAIVFKKNKILYALLTFFIARIVLGIIILIFVLLFRELDLNEFFNFSENKFFWELMGLIGMMTLSFIFYGISYHLFFRRQL